MAAEAGPRSITGTTSKAARIIVDRAASPTSSALAMASSMARLGAAPVAPGPVPGAPR